MSTTIIHKRRENGELLLDEVFVNGKFLFLSNFEISKNSFTLAEQNAIKSHLKGLKYFNYKKTTYEY